MLAIRKRQQTEMLVAEHTGPGIAEVCNPSDARCPLETASNQVHRLRRSRCNYRIYRMFLEVVNKESYRRLYPRNARIRDKAVAPDEQRKLLLETFLAGIDGIDPALSL